MTIVLDCRLTRRLPTTGIGSRLERPRSSRAAASAAPWLRRFIASPASRLALVAIAMIVVSVPSSAATSTWVAAGLPGNSDFSYALNWDAVPSPAGDVDFPAGSAFVAKGAPVNDTSGMSINNINIYEAYNITGNAVTCSGVNDNNATTATIAMPLATPGTAVMTVTVTSAGGVLYLSGILSGAGPVTFGGPGNSVLSNAGNTVSGITTLGQGTLHIWGSLAASPITVTMGTLVLSNDSVVNNLTLSGSSSILSCAETLAAEDMHATCGALTFGSSSEFLVVTKGAAATAYTNMSVGSATLTSGRLVVDTSFYMPAASSVMTIIHNAGAVTGTFAGLVEGATVTSSTNAATTFTISYIGGAGGHDVTLTASASDGAGTAGGTSTGLATTGTGTGTATGTGTGTATGTAVSSGGSSSKCGLGGAGIGLLLAVGLLAVRRKS
jgi:hypothetical protein